MDDAPIGIDEIYYQQIRRLAHIWGGLRGRYVFGGGLRGRYIFWGGLRGRYIFWGGLHGPLASRPYESAYVGAHRDAPAYDAPTGIGDIYHAQPRRAVYIWGGLHGRLASRPYESAYVGAHRDAPAYDAPACEAPIGIGDIYYRQPTRAVYILGTLHGRLASRPYESAHVGARRDAPVYDPPACGDSALRADKDKGRLKRRYAPFFGLRPTALSDQQPLIWVTTKPPENRACCCDCRDRRRRGRRRARRTERGSTNRHAPPGH